MSSTSERFAPLLATLCLAAATAAGAQTVAITGATAIDGTGRAPIPDAVVLIHDGRITALGSARDVSIPENATRIDARGKFVIPGLMDANLHLYLNGDVESLVKYEDRYHEVILEGAQIALKTGMTTVFDTWGPRAALIRARDMIAAGQAPGARIFLAGNIIGFSGPLGADFRGTSAALVSKAFAKRTNETWEQGTGRDLLWMPPDSLRAAIRAYTGRGVDFLKYGASGHVDMNFVAFSQRAQKVIVDAAHARNRAAETHSTSIEGLRLSIAAGIDGIQHPELLDGREMPDDLVKTIVDRGLNCSMLASSITGPAWKRHVKTKDEVEKKRADAAKDARVPAREKTTAERRKDASEEGADLEMRRTNAQKLIRAGCRVTPGTDSYWAAAPEFTRTPKFPEQDHGIGTIMAIEGLVELGMTPAQAIVAATRNGAAAARGLKDFGTIEAGKFADLVLLTANPLADIANIRKVALVLKDGRQVDRDHLPQAHVLSPL